MTSKTRVTMAATSMARFDQKPGSKVGRFPVINVVEPLIESLSDRDDSVRAHAAEALGALGGARAVEPLIRALGDVDWVRKHAVKALADLGEPEWGRRVTGYNARGNSNLLEDFRSLVATGDLRAIRVVFEALKHSNSDVRWAARHEIEKVRDPRMIDLLADALRADRPETRRVAAKALGQMRNPDTLAPLVGAIGDGDVERNRERGSA
jgi:HEAT repeat protein